jgi:photosystem II stability/assembly factor-like uncharacterized protein
MSVQRLAVIAVLSLIALSSTTRAEEDEARFSSSTFEGMKLRSIGPAFMSGRVADVALHPDDPNIWYVGIGSGGVWKTVNAGTTWTPIFDDQESYSIGCITIDPSNPHTIWVGTGENVGGRHVGFGDGIYRSRDDGASWENLGLGDSQHISRIIVSPDDSNTVWVAAQGPLWSKGGDRGVFKTTDGGKTWSKTLGDDEWTGATDILIDPRDPQRLFAATWQHQRSVAGYMGGGPETGIYRSTDGGNSWEELTEGLPEGNMAKIGLAISPQKPDVLYAAIELDRRTGKVFRSSNRGSSWEEMSETVSGGTGPHYYQELYASPHAFDRIYLADVRMQISDDGGKTFVEMNETAKHSDNHSVTFRLDDEDYLLVGTDGGLYESFDLAENWRYVANLPTTQFYKVAVDDAKPFYNVFGGTQDNNTQGGPSRTDHKNGIRNADWSVILPADGHQPATEPGNPDIMYAEWQQGNLNRIDRTTGEFVYIKPQPEKGEPAERFNWDAPILISPHDPARIYYASQRVWRSDDRGDSWRTLSGDLTRNQDRMLFEYMDRKWSWDAPWDVLAMSAYNTITSLSESPQLDGLIYAGTDDGLIQVTEDGGENWRRIEVGSLPGVPDTAFINDIKADLFDADTVYVSLDNHKFGDFKPYLVKSTNRGRSWKSIRGDLPERNLVWRLVQDHVQAKLLFLGTEFGLYFSVDGGQKWLQLAGGVPTISFRDLAIQRRENDLVAATFGRGFYILDDYTPLRHISERSLEQDAILFPTRTARWYQEGAKIGSSSPAASQGASYFVAENPPFGAVFTYFLGDDLQSREEKRQATEKPLLENGADTPFPGWDAVEAERRETDPAVLILVKDGDGNIVQRVDGETSKGMHRIAWNLRYPQNDPLPTEETHFEAPQGYLAAPGNYTATLVKQVDGQTTAIADPIEFDVVQMRSGALQGSTAAETTAYWRDVAALERSVSGAVVTITNTFERIELLEQSLALSLADPETMDAELNSLKQELYDIEAILNGNQSKAAVGELGPHTIKMRLWYAGYGSARSTYGPTATQRRSFEIASGEYADIRERLNVLVTTALPDFERRLQAAGAPWTPTSAIPDTE